MNAAEIIHVMRVPPYDEAPVGTEKLFKFQLGLDLLEQKMRLSRLERVYANGRFSVWEIWVIVKGDRYVNKIC